MIFLFPSPSPPPPHWQPVFYSSPFILYWRRLTSSPSLHFSLRPMWFPQRIFHTFRKMNESWSLIWWAKLSGALDKMIESHNKSYTDKLQDITCARGWGLVLILVWQTQVDDFSAHVQVTWRLWNYHPLTLHNTRLGIPLDRRITHLATQLTAAMRKEARPNAFSGLQPW